MKPVTTLAELAELFDGVYYYELNEREQKIVECLLWHCLLEKSKFGKLSI